MRKLYLLLMTLFVQLITVGSLFAADPPKEEYDAAMETIEDGTIYFITTEIEGETWYLKTDGNITREFAEAGMFAVTKKTGGKLYDVGLRIDGGTGKYFSNTAKENNKAKLNPGNLQLTTLDRDDYERQVPFMNSEGKIAIRTCNIAYGESDWADCGRVFWTVDEGNSTTCYSYDPDYRWSFVVVTEKDKIRFVMDAIYNTYEEQVWDEEEGGYTLNMGEGVGQRTDWDSWRELWNLLQVVNDVCQKFVDEDNPDYDPATDPDAPSTQAEAEEMKALADSLYQKILDSEVPYTVPDGYYRIFAMNRYKSTYTSDPSGFVDKAIAASYDKNHANRVVFSTLDRSKAHFLWKFTKSESGDSILMQNAGMETYISLASVKQGKLVTTEDVNEATHVVFDYAYSLDGPQTVYPDGIAAEKDIICIRPAQLPRAGDSSYFHQNGHSSVSDDKSPWSPWTNYGTDSGQEQEMAFWMRTWDWRNSEGNGRTSDLNASEWYLESVDAEEAEQLIADFEVIKNHDVLVARNNELRAQVLETMTLAKDVIRTKLITSASQMSSPYSHNDQAGNGRDGGDLSAGVLIDGDASTYWHSAWKNSPDGQHYIELTGMEDMVGDCEFYLRERAGAANDRPKQFLLLGTDNLKNADEDWVEITTINIPNFAAGAESTVPFYVETAYPYVRVVGVDCDPSYRTFWHAAELQILTVRDNPNSQFAQLGEVAETLEATYNANVATADEDITLEIYQALLDAYNTFISSGLVDPAELRAALATYAKATAGVVEGNNPGQWSNTEVPDAYDALYAEVEAYDKAGRYDAAQIHKYAVMLKAMQENIMESANKVETDKWYRIMFPTEEMYDEYGFGKDGGDNCNDLTREEQHTMYGTFVVPAKLNSEQGIGYDDEGNEITTTDTWVEGIFGEDSRESDRLFFLGDDEIDDKDFSMFRLVEAGETTADYGVLLTQMKGMMSMALELNAARGKKLINDVSQLSSNSLDRAEGNNLEYLIDGNISTYWHSDYHKDVLAPPYLQVAFDEPISGLIQVEVTRRQNATNGHIVRMYVQGSTDAENWDFMGYLETPFTNQNESVTSQVVNLSAPCKYLRFILTNRYGTDAGGNTEFDPFPEITSPDEYNKLWTYCHAAEFQIYSFTSGASSSADEALLQAYMNVNKVLPKDATEENFATASQAYEDFRTDFNTKEGKPVLPSGSGTNPVYALQNKATGLFVFVDGTGSQNNIYLKTIPSLVTWKAIGYQRSLLGVSNLKGESQNYLHAGESNRRFCTWSTTEPTTNSGLVICEADVDYEAPEEFTFYKNVKPGRIVDWCHSVSLTAVDAPDDASAYTVLGQYTEGEGEDAETYLALKALETIEAGQPALFIYGDTTSYDAEDDYVEPIKFKIPGDGELALKGTTENGFIGTLVAASYKSGIIYFNANYAKDVKNGYVVNVTPCSAVLDISLCPEVNPDEAYDFSIYLGQVAKDAATGVKDVTSAIEKISQRGNVYGMDGKLIRTGATLNDLKALGTGMYILNGVKVMVK